MIGTESKKILETGSPSSDALRKQRRRLQRKAYQKPVDYLHQIIIRPPIKFDPRV